jgi:hypothetical protein
MAALDRLQPPEHVDLLITHTRFRCTGSTLASMARVKRPGIKIVITAAPALVNLPMASGPLCSRLFISEPRAAASPGSQQRVV